MKLYRYVFWVMIACFLQKVQAQEKIFLGPGIGTNRNKKVVESDTRRYLLMPAYQDYKIDLGFFMQKHFYLNASFNVYRQEIRSSPSLPPSYPQEGVPQTGFVHSAYTYVSNYRYQGFTVAPGFAAGNKVKFFAGAGFNLDFSRIDGNRVLVSEDHYRYDSLGQATWEYNMSYDTTNQLIQRKGSDFSGLVQTGLIVELGRSLILQVNVYYRRSLVLQSLETKKDYKSNTGLALSILYRLWNNAPAQKEPDPVE